MGSLTHHPISRWRDLYGLKQFVETGFYHGDGLRHAVEQGFAPMKSYSIEINTALIAQFGPRVPGGIIINADSVSGVAEVLTIMDDTPALWWLDAHYPTQYGWHWHHEKDTLPLLPEIQLISTDPTREGDVIIIDDTRIYGRECANGPLPEGWQAGAAEDLESAVKLLEYTHTVEFDSRSEGYMLAFPKPVRT